MWETLPCASWPATAADRYAGPWDRRTADLHLPPTPNMRAALGDAAWMAAMERNSDLVTMQCYAPLFVNVNGYQWRPDLIGYDALNSYGSPSYYAQKIFSRHQGDEVLAVTARDLPEYAWIHAGRPRNGK